MIINNKKKTNINKYNSLDKTQKGGGIWACSPFPVKYDNINQALKDIVSAKKMKLIKLIFNARDRGSKDWASWARPGYRCLDKYLEAYYTLTTDTTKIPNIRTISTDKLIKMGLKKRYRILLGLIYLYLKKNIALDTNRLDTFYKQLAIARTAITKAVATTTKSSPKPTQSLDKKAIKQEYYKNVFLAANTLLGKNLPNESQLIIEYDNELKRVKAEQARLETKSYQGMADTSTNILRSQKERALAQSSLASNVVAGMTEQQIVDMRKNISEGLMTLTMYMGKYNGLNKALYEQQINNYNTQFQAIEVKVAAKGYIITDTEKIELKKLEQDVLTLLKILEKTLDPKNIVKKRMILPDKLGYTSLYGMTSEKMNSLLKNDKGFFQSDKSTYKELLRILNEMDPATININEALNPNVVKLLNFINGLVNPYEIYREIKIEIRDSILQQIIKNNKISDYEDIVVNILKSMNDNDLSTFENITKHNYIQVN
jgi:hypothetical protein